MNPDVLITVAFVGVAVLVAVAALVLVAPQIWREEARIARAESREREHAHGADLRRL